MAVFEPTVFSLWGKLTYLYVGKYISLLWGVQGYLPSSRLAFWIWLTIWSYSTSAISLRYQLRRPQAYLFGNLVEHLGKKFPNDCEPVDPVFVVVSVVNELDLRNLFGTGKIQFVRMDPQFGENGSVLCSQDATLEKFLKNN